jgi:lipopolysaccharide/colanic/teichoic acid biosynthesis glycosyltransferase
LFNKRLWTKINKIMSRIEKIIDFIFYRSERVGKNGKQFKLWKFRTMCKDADRIGAFSVATGDLRVTSIGRVLRRTHIDELPNIINVIKGEMSIIGPRPEIPFYVDRMPEKIKNVILSVKPGCIDTATLWNIDEGKKLEGQADPDLYYEQYIWPEKLRLQCQSILKRRI